jgi:hypothetical protein
MNTMNLPGFTADISLYKTSGHYRTMPGTPNELAPAALTLALSRNAMAYVDAGRNTASVFVAQQRTVVPQSCDVETLAVCSPWINGCFYGPCKWARIFGSGACTGCMTACLWATNPLFALACTECAAPGPCRFGIGSGLGFRSSGCFLNICA